VRLAPLAVAFTLGALVAGAALGGVSRFERAFAGRPVVLVGDWRLRPDAELRPFVTELATRVAEREAFFAAPEADQAASFAELGIELDVDATLAALVRALPVRTTRERFFELFRGEPEPPVVPLHYAVNSDRARAWLGRLAEQLHRDPVNARLDLVRHQRVEAAPGRELDVGASLHGIETGERTDLARFELAFFPVEPSVSSAELAQVDVTRVLSSFETDFSHKPRSRIPNIRTGARYLNGVILAPGQVFSFNQVVGPRTEARGFRNAPVIVQDELEPGLGGGICQVATAVFASAMLGGLEIVERRSHSRPSGYAPLGLDATVIYPEVDLRLRNPYDTPLMIHAVVTNAKVIRVEFLGRDAPGKVEHFFASAKPEPYGRRVVVKSELAPGTIDKRQKGNPGYDGRSTLLTTYPDGSREARTYPSKYYPVPEVFWIASNVELAALPPLPEGATGVTVTTEGNPVDGERGDQPEP
jgi:vancomycin resistance protein YoaR